MKQNFYAEKKGRLDQYLETILPFTRSQIKNYIREGEILLNGNRVKAGYCLKKGEKIEINISENTPLLAEKIDFNVKYEDDDIAVISKPQNLVVHPGAGNSQHTLVNGLLYRFSAISNPLDSTRPGIVHRLDKDTSGLMIISKTEKAYYNLVQMFKENKIHKKYLAFVHGKLLEGGIIDAPIGRNPKNRKQMAVVETHSKPATTRYDILENYEECTLLKVNLITGRTHQIRVHMSYIHHPIVGDLTYGHKNKWGITSQLLHAYELNFIHPVTNLPMSFIDDFPERFKTFENRVKNKKV